jgi:hypothetical protein
LAQALDASAPDIGYRLRLRRSSYQANVEMELEKLRIKRAEVDQRIAHLESVAQQRPYLLRFGPGQLRALADTLYSFSVESLSGEEGGVRYAFRANRHAPAGFHYLLVGPQTVLRELDPLHLYGNEPPIRFWLDPSWARYYPDAGNVCYVFVPEHTALSPSLHTWQTEDMDRHLRRMLESRWQRETGERAFPQGAYYVFDAASPDGQDLNLTVLAPSDFGLPQARLHWISDNLTVSQGIPIERYLSGTAEALGWQRIANDAAGAAAAAQAAFQAAVRATREQFAAELSLMVREIKSGTENVILEIVRLIPELEKLDAKRAEVIDAKARAESGIPALEDLITNLAARTGEFQDKLAAVEASMAAALVDAERLLEQDKQDMLALVKAQRLKRDALLEDLSMMRRGWRD